MAFDLQIIEALHKLASEVLEIKMYKRLAVVSHYLALFSEGQWNRLGDDERAVFVEKMAADFHPKGWDDLSWSEGSAFPQLSELLSWSKRIKN